MALFGKKDKKNTFRSRNSLASTGSEASNWFTGIYHALKSVFIDMKSMSYQKGRFNIATIIAFLVFIISAIIIVISFFKGGLF